MSTVLAAFSQGGAARSSGECLSARRALPTRQGQGGYRQGQKTQKHAIQAGAHRRAGPCRHSFSFPEHCEGSRSCVRQSANFTYSSQPTPANKMASVLSQMLLLEIYSFVNRSIYSQVKPWPLVSMSGPPRPWEMDANTRRQRVRSLLFQAALWAPTIGEKDSILEAL